MAKKLHQGDRVKWKSGNGQALGIIKQKITETTEVNGKTINGDADNPRYLVENEKTKKVSVRKSKTLKKIKLSNHNFDQNQQQLIEEFNDLVNLSPKKLNKWLKTASSKTVGQKEKEGEAKGHKSGKKILKILKKDRSKYTEKDFKHMQKVISYVHRHLAQKPSGEIKDTPWRYSLMNWGHDPIKSK